VAVGVHPARRRRQLRLQSREILSIAPLELSPFASGEGGNGEGGNGEGGHFAGQRSKADCCGVEITRCFRRRELHHIMSVIAQSRIQTWRDT